MAHSLLILLLSAGSMAANTPEATLFTEENCEGDSLVVTIQNGGNIPDLASYDFTNKTKSVLLAGSWIFYGAPNYNLNADRNKRMPYYFEAPLCADTFYNVSSLRLIGDPTNFKANTITLFDETLFTGNAQVVKKNMIELKPSSDNQFSFSWVITGSSAWTFFSEKNLTGVARCYQPGDSYLGRFEDVTAFLKPSIYWRDAKSVRRGCHVEKAED